MIMGYRDLPRNHSPISETIYAGKETTKISELYLELMILSITLINGVGFFYPNPFINNLTRLLVFSWLYLF
jgi:hypothetical protein